VGVTTRQAVLIAGLVAAAVAAPSIRNDFVADDQWVVANREVLEHPPSVGAVLKEPYWPASFGGVMWRPAVISSFALDYRVSSSPHWFHAINVLWAVLTTALFALLACELAGPGVGLVTGLFFAVHPVHVEAVANVVGRAEMMAAAGYAAALLCVVRAERKPAYLAGVAAGAASAITSKEIAVTLPAAVLLILWARRADLRLAWRAVVAATVPIVAYFIIQGLVGIRTLYAGGLAVGLEHVGFLARAWAMVRLSLEWWRLFLLPAHLSADYSPGELTVSTALTFWHLVGLLIWIAAGVLAWRTRRTVPGIAIGLAWMVITISPVANIVFPTEFLIAERTLYLASHWRGRYSRFGRPGCELASSPPSWRPVQRAASPGFRPGTTMRRTIKRSSAKRRAPIVRCGSKGKTNSRRGTGAAASSCCASQSRSLRHSRGRATTSARSTCGLNSGNPPFSNYKRRWQSTVRSSPRATRCAGRCKPPATLSAKCSFLLRATETRQAC